MTMSAYVNINPTSVRTRHCRPLPKCRCSKYVIGTDVAFGYGVYRHFQPYFSYIVTNNFISGGNRSARKKLPNFTI